MMTRHAKASLRSFLQAAGRGKQLIAYLTIGDPPNLFEQVAEEVLEAGALTLELGCPYPRHRKAPNCWPLTSEPCRPASTPNGR